MSFTLGALTREQRENLALNGQSVSFFMDDIADQIELGGTLEAGECFNPISVGTKSYSCMTLNGLGQVQHIRGKDVS
jgi:hypothetical protein